ncbi:MAG: citrate synthase [Phycisphaerae bacterium]|nr:MAG: citrate synthase [Planctomycetia bacterium]RIK71773.1 MAG: citrate synthase [Planctomycetota bacterium]GJQ25475.1 MAG: citrate synthase [Phycisphaerae bacterium]
MADSTSKGGLEGVHAGATSVCEITQTSLRYRGYDIADLAEHTCFDEVAHLLLHGELPNKSQLAAFRQRVQAAMTLPEPAARALAEMPKTIPPMDMLRTVVSIIGHFDPDAQDLSRDACLRKSERLLGQIAAAVGAWSQKTQGVPAIKPDPSASHGANILAMILGKRPSDLAGRVFDGTLILYAEHEFNASTFTARVIASTLSDLHSAVSGAIGALKGPLHGGANEAAMNQFLEIGKKENVQKWFDDLNAHNKAHPDNKRLIMGFGHRVYKNGDHRAGILRGWSLQLTKETGQGHWIDIADALQALMLKEKNIHPNLDYPAAHAYYQMGVPIPLYTPIFVCSRVTGWCAHIMEQYANNRIIRPLSEYTGPALRPVPPMDKR